MFILRLIGKLNSQDIPGSKDMSCSRTTRLEDEGVGQGSKRARTIFTAEQLEQMEREFHKQQYVVGHERMYLANALNLTEAQVPIR